MTLNKRADTILPFFLLACAEFGWPSRVRFDRGTEGVAIARRQTEHWLERGYPADRGSFLVGRSVHNTRIEAMWNFLSKTATGFYRLLFNDMEIRLHILDPFDPRHLFALHRAFMKRIKSAPPPPPPPSDACSFFSASQLSLLPSLASRRGAEEVRADVEQASHPWAGDGEGPWGRRA